MFYLCRKRHLTTRQLRSLIKIVLKGLKTMSIGSISKPFRKAHAPWKGKRRMTRSQWIEQFLNDCREELRDYGCYDEWLTLKSPATFSTNEMQTETKHLVREFFPRFGQVRGSYLQFRFVMIALFARVVIDFRQDSTIPILRATWDNYYIIK